jgi:hypothetical protein
LYGSPTRDARSRRGVAVSGERHDPADSAGDSLVYFLKPANLDVLSPRWRPCRAALRLGRLLARVLGWFAPDVHTRLIESKADCALEGDDEIGLTYADRPLADRTGHATGAQPAHDRLQPSKW